MRRFAIGVSLCALFALACGGTGGGSDPVPADAADVPADVADDADVADAADVSADADAADVPADLPWPPFDPTACGAAPHTWLPAADVGAVVTFAPHELLADMAGKDIDALLTQAKYGRMTPVPYGVKNFRLRYVTQDKGVKVEATALVGVPVGVPAGTPTPVVLWLHGTSGFNDQCAPSRNPTDGPLSTTLISSQGWITVAPDFVGMIGDDGTPSPAGTLTPYLVSETTAIASLDAVRAVQRALAGDATLPQADPSRLVPFGASQGGHAAYMVDRYLPHYAPELRHVAVVALVPPADLTGLATYAASHYGPAAGTLVFAFASFQRWYGVPADLSAVLTDTDPLHLATDVQHVMATTCDDGGLGDQVSSLAEVYQPDFLAKGAAGQWDALAPWGCFLAVNSVRTSPVPRAVDVPVLAAYAEEDDLVVTPVERANVPALCAAGYRIEYLECAGKSHTKGAVAALPYAFSWVRKRVAGEAWPAAGTTACTVTAPVDCDTLGP